MTDEFLKWFGEYAARRTEEWRLQHPELMDAYQAACEEQKRPYSIGDLTSKRVFAANGIHNISDLQVVFNAVEAELDKALKFASHAESYGAAQGYTLAVEHCADAVTKAYRANMGKPWFTDTQLVAIISSVKWETRQGAGVLSNAELISIRSSEAISTNRGVYNLGVEDAAVKLIQFSKDHGLPHTLTEICAAIRSFKKTGDDIPEFVEVVPVPPAVKEQAEKEELLAELMPMATEIKDQDGHPVEMLVPPTPWMQDNLVPYADNTPLICETKSALEDLSLSGSPVYPDSFDWHYVECKNHGPNDKSLCGWFPTLQLANAHRNFWPQHLKDCMVIKPRSIVDPGIALYFPEQAGSDILRGTNEFLVLCGLTKVGLGERYFPAPEKPKPKPVKNPDIAARLENIGAMNDDQETARAAYDGAAEIRKLRAEIGAMSKLLHGEPPQNGSLVARLEALVERAAEMESRGTVLGVGEWDYALGDRVFKPKGSWWEGKIVGFYSTMQTPRGYAVQLQTSGDNGPVQIYPESALEFRP